MAKKLKVVSDRFSREAVEITVDKFHQYARELGWDTPLDQHFDGNYEYWTDNTGAVILSNHPIHTGGK